MHSAAIISVELFLPTVLIVVVVDGAVRPLRMQAAPETQPVGHKRGETRSS